MQREARKCQRYAERRERGSHGGCALERLPKSRATGASVGRNHRVRRQVQRHGADEVAKQREEKARLEGPPLRRAASDEQ